MPDSQKQPQKTVPDVPEESKTPKGESDRMLWWHDHPEANGTSPDSQS